MFSECFHFEGDELWNTLDISSAEFNSRVFVSFYDLYMEIVVCGISKKDTMNVARIFISLILLIVIVMADEMEDISVVMFYT